MKPQDHNPREWVGQRARQYAFLTFLLAIGQMGSLRAVPAQGSSAQGYSVSQESRGGTAWYGTGEDQHTLERKLAHPGPILGEFENGSERVKVIVNLMEPPTSIEEPTPGQVHKAEVVRRYRERLGKRHAEVHVIQTPVLETLTASEFQPRHRFSNWASFAGEVTLDGLKKLAADPLVESIEFDYPMKRLTKQGIALMNGTTVRTTYNGQGVAIAIVDDGIDYRHPKLGNGGFPNGKVIGGYDVADGDSNPGPDLNLADCAHGTNCAGIAAGDVGTTGDYMGGVAPGAKLYAVKVFKRDGSVYDSDLIAAWDWCINHKSDDPAHPILVISVSLGQDSASIPSVNYTASVRKAADVVRAGITLVAAAGNSGWCNALEWPAALRDVISVGAVYDAALGTITWPVDKDSCASKTWNWRDRQWYADDVTAADKVAVYSNVASTLGLFAPSNDAYTTDVVGAPGVPGDYEPEFGGTSASSPYAAGAVACLQSAAYAHDGQYLSPAQVRDVLTRTGDLVTDTKTPITKPRINLGRAVAEALSGRAALLTPVYRFWSATLSRHFFTIDVEERNKLLDTYSRTWTYEGIVYRALTDAGAPGSAAVYRFWSPSLSTHFYTISESERDGLINNYAAVWSYEGPVFRAYPEGSQPAGTYPVHRFWSGTLKTHFYTISETEKNKLINTYSRAWTYEGIAWYAYK